MSKVVVLKLLFEMPLGNLYQIMYWLHVVILKE